MITEQSAIKKALLDAAGSNWSIFDALANTPEPERRRILRSHKEAPFSSSVDIAMRDAVDDTLGRLMLLEGARDFSDEERTKRVETVRKRIKDVKEQNKPGARGTGPFGGAGAGGPGGSGS